MAKCLWKPNQERINSANITDFTKQVEQKFGVTLPDYSALHRWSVENPEAFWSFFWLYAKVTCSHPWDKVIDHPEEMKKAQWFTGCKMNFAENLLRHSGNKTALISYLENGTHHSISYDDLKLKVNRLAATLKQFGVQPGDRVAGFMPNIVETIIAMLATSTLGAIWSSCSPDFGEQGVLDRFGQIQPKILFATDGYFYGGKTIDTLQRIENITRQLTGLNKVIVVPVIKETPSLKSIDNSLLWQDALDIAPQHIQVPFEQVPFNHPQYIMYSSGTTGTPKCIVHSAGGTLLQHLKEHLLHVDLKPTDTLFYFTTCGWMMWNWLVSGLATGATVVLYDGSPTFPDTNALLNLIDQEKITIFGTSPRYLSALEKSGAHPKQTHQLHSLKTILSTGSPLTHEGFNYVYEKVKEDVCLSSITGGTDIISCFVLGNHTLPVYQGQLQCRGLALDVDIFNDEGHPVREEKGELVCKQPFPSMPVAFWNDPTGEKYHNAYFARFDNVWAHGDYGEITAEDGMIIYGRSDAVLNPGGVRIGTAEIYRQVEKLDWIQESIAVGQQWQDDVRVILFVVLKPELRLTEAGVIEIKQVIRNNTTPRHVPAKVIQVEDIPRTISGKIVELAVRNVIHGEVVKNTDALANPQALNYFKDLEELRT